MKVRSSVYTCIALAVYILLLICFFYREKPDYTRNKRYKNCTYTDVCLTFCEQGDYGQFTDDYIKQHFPYKKFPKFTEMSYDEEKVGDNKTREFQIMKDVVECKSFEHRKIISDESEWTLYYGGDVRYENFYYSDNYYCLQPYAEHEDEFKVKLELCVFNSLLLTPLHYLLLIVTAVLIILPAVVYFKFAEIRQTLHGKVCIALLVTQIYMIFIMPLEEIYFSYSFFVVSAVLAIAGAYSTIFIMNLMCFDIYLTFKHFREPAYHSNYFKKFVYFLLIFFTVAALSTYAYSFNRRRLSDLLPAMGLAFFFTFALTVIMNIFALLASFYYLITLTRSTTVSENTRFDVERERFWLYIKLFVIISVAWFVEITNAAWYLPDEPLIVGDLIKCYSAGMSAFLLIWTPRVYALVFKKYSTMGEDDVENNRS